MVVFDRELREELELPPLQTELVRESLGTTRARGGLAAGAARAAAGGEARGVTIAKRVVQSCRKSAGPSPEPADREERGELLMTGWLGAGHDSLRPQA